MFEAVGNPCVGGSPYSVAGREAGNFSGMFFKLAANANSVLHYNEAFSERQVMDSW